MTLEKLKNVFEPIICYLGRQISLSGFAQRVFLFYGCGAEELLNLLG